MAVGKKNVKRELAIARSAALDRLVELVSSCMSLYVPAKDEALKIIENLRD